MGPGNSHTLPHTPWNQLLWAKPPPTSSTTKILITCQKQWASFSNAWTFGAHQTTSTSLRTSSISVKTSPPPPKKTRNSKQPWRKSRRMQYARRTRNKMYQKEMGWRKENSPWQKWTQTVPKCFLSSAATCLEMIARRGSCCFDWALTCLKASSSEAKNNCAFVRGNWNISNSETRCYYITLYCVTTARSAYSRTSRWAPQAWCCLWVPGSGSTLRGAGLKPEHSPWEGCITETQGFPAVVDHDLPLRCVCVTLHILAHIPIRVTHIC